MTVLQTLSHLAVPLVVLGTLLLAGKALLRPHGPDVAGAAGSLFAGGVLAALLVVGPGRLAAGVDALFGSLTGHPTRPARAAAPAGAHASPAPVHPGPAVDWHPVLAVAAVVAAVAVALAAAAAATVFTRARLRAGRAQAAQEQAALAQRAQLWDALRARHDAVKDAYAAYREDITAVLTRPALNDVTVAQTAAFVDAAARALDVRREDAPDGAALQVYEQAVRALERTWSTASAHARRVGQNLLSAQERRAVRTAMKLLALAADGAASPAERQRCYERAATLLAGVIDLPREAVAVLEASHRLALTA